MARSWVGRSLPRLEDQRLITGRGRYVADHTDHGPLQLVLVRSPVAHARLASIDLTAVAAMPGVRAVFTAADLAGLHSLGVMPVDADHVVAIGTPLLAAGRVRFAGEPVAAVVAETRAQAADAADYADVDYEPLPVVIDPRSAAAADPLHDQAPGNILLRTVRRGGDVDAAFRDAAHVIEATLSMPRLVAAPMEPRAAIASYDAADDIVTVLLSAQDPHRPRAQLAAALGRPPDSVRIVVPDVGGAFGSKGALPAEAAVAAFAAMRLREPVQWTETRSENFLAAPQGRGQSADVALAVDADGRFLGMRVQLLADLGAYLHFNTFTPPLLAAGLVAGVYKTGAVEVTVTGVATNKVPTGPYRGAGRPEGAYIAERMADLAARRLGIDPVEIRRRNLIAPADFPYQTALGDRIDFCDYPRLMERACELIDYDGTRRRHAAERLAGRLPGLGIAVFSEPTGRGLWESASVEVAKDGTMLARMGSSSHGQGHATAFAQVLADELELDPAQVAITYGDSAEVPAGMGTYSSRSAMLAGSALVLAARDLRERLCQRGADQLELPRAAVSWQGGRVVAADGREVSSADIAGGLDAAALARDFTAASRFTLDTPLYAAGAFAVELEIDPDTGKITIRRIAGVHDGGRILNPKIAEGQVTGAVVQGLGEALSEEAVYAEDGQLISGSLMTYGMLAAPDVPGMEGEFIETGPALTPVGAKGIGETGTTGIPAATANAVADALWSLGVRDVQMPFGPERIWRYIRTASLTTSRH